LLSCLLNQSDFVRINFILLFDFMITSFFRLDSISDSQSVSAHDAQGSIIAVQHHAAFADDAIERLSWLFEARQITETQLKGSFIGPRKEILTPWSTNASEIAQSIGVSGINRMEQFRVVLDGGLAAYDRMLETLYEGLNQSTLSVSVQPEQSFAVDDIAAYNSEAGLALSAAEVDYLVEQQKLIGRKLTDCEIYAFSQINSEHCRHKIFNGQFIIDGEEKGLSLFDLIRRTAKKSPQRLVSAYKDNVAFVRGPSIKQFAPASILSLEAGSYFSVREIDAVISLKAETHNFPTTVEPFYGASTGSGGEIRDRMAGGMGSIPLAGTAVYMTSYPRLRGSLAQDWEKHSKERDWKYQSPLDILIKASNGASDFGNKFGQPLICGSLLTFELNSPRGFYAYDRTIMLAGGVGYANAKYALKLAAQVGDRLLLMGGDNYRIGMAGGSVSSVASGELSEALELSAIQRANPEMQKRVYNALRALLEDEENPIRLIHDHGAGGHVNCFSELLEEQGGEVLIDKLPVGDPTLSFKEIICNESQERMGLIVAKEDVANVLRVAGRERAPCYDVGEVKGDQHLTFAAGEGDKPIDLPLETLFGSAPKTVLEDSLEQIEFSELEYSISDGAQLRSSLERVLSLEAVACKDWLTNKVDRSVTGLVAQQQCVGPLQLPLSNLGVMALDFTAQSGIATAIGHAPIPALIDAGAGSVLSVAESLTNIVWAPLADGLSSVALSANWMWPAKQPGENARLYQAVEKISEFAEALGIAIPTGKDSLSMTMNYSDGSSVRAPGTVVVTAVAQCADVRKCVTPDLKPLNGSLLLYLDLSNSRENHLGGSSFAQSLAQLGKRVPEVFSPEEFSKGFDFVQSLVKAGKLLAGHDVSSGGLISALCEMAFAGDIGFDCSIDGAQSAIIPKLFCEKPGVILQVLPDEFVEISSAAQKLGLNLQKLGSVSGKNISFHLADFSFLATVSELRRVWYKPSFLLDRKQTTESCAKERFETFAAHPLSFKFPEDFSSSLITLGLDLCRKGKTGIRAAIIREKGTNGDREMAHALFVAGFDVKDIAMSDIIDSRETLEDVNLIVFPGGFSNSDVLGAARGWAGVFKYNVQAKKVLSAYLERSNTLTLGVCNGCQLLVGLDLIYPEHAEKMQMHQNESAKFESNFLGVRVAEETNSVFLKALRGAQLGAWVAHAEGRFSLPKNHGEYDIALKYLSADYPANPNGADGNAAAISSANGRNLAIMPHIERSLFSWNWAYRGVDPEIANFEVSPWILAFTSAREWVEERVA